MLDTLSVRLEMDIRLLRCVGPVRRMPAERWEHKLFFGRVRKEHETEHVNGKDLWWDRVRMLCKEVMTHCTEELMWYEVAQDADAWRKLCFVWRKARISEERRDTQRSRETRWELAASGYQSKVMADLIWDGVKKPTAVGTPLEGEPEQLLKHLILAGGVAKAGWLSGVDRDWIWMCRDEASQAWLEKEGARIRRRVLGRGWLEKLKGVPLTAQLPDMVVMRRRMQSKMPEGRTVSQVYPMAPPPPPPPRLVGEPLGAGVPVRRRLRWKQPEPVRSVEADPEGEAPALNAEVSDDVNVEL